jgi:chromate transporter
MVLMKGKLLESFLVPLKLGLTSFGGPIAHLGYFHNEYVLKRKWLDEQSYTDLVALCQFLPGPASSQLGIAIGTIHAGLPGGIAAWLGFTLPSAIVLILFAMLLRNYNLSGAGWVHGLKIVAVAIVAQAVITMWRNLITDKIRAAIAISSLVILLFWQASFSQLIIIIAAGVAGIFLFGKKGDFKPAEVKVPVSKSTAIISLILFFVLLAVLPMI